MLASIFNTTDRSGGAGIEAKHGLWHQGRAAVVRVALDHFRADAAEVTRS